ncbi:MAG: hypothetical protein HC852_02880 [Acaryochloridaceae cyanobacterium RU_4_10]|nr:hypothetical protein [Acaryochloridaceae cyanobacterium RU_4_10]
MGAKDKAGDGLKGSQAMDKAMDEHKGAGIGAEPKKGDIGSGQKKKKRLLDGVKMR